MSVIAQVFVSLLPGAGPRSGEDYLYVLKRNQPRADPRCSEGDWSVAGNGLGGEAQPDTPPIGVRFREYEHRQGVTARGAV